MRVIWPEAQRGYAKINNFSTIYRISPGSLAVKIRNSEENAQKSIEAFYKRYPRVATYHRQAIAFAAKHGYAQTIDGFKRFLDTTPRKNRWSGKMEMAWSVANEAINTPIQGSAAALAKRAMIDMHDEWQRLGVYGSQVVLAGQEHDSILAEARDEYADEAMALMKSKMEHAAVLRVPLVAEGGKGRSWSEAKG
jgi:DNA polymerase-1